MWEENVYYILYLLFGFIFFILVFKTPNFVKYYSKFAFYFIGTEIISVIIIPIMALAPRNVKNILVLSHSMKHMTKVLGVTWVIRNKKVLREAEGAVMISNHQSCLDLLGMYHVVCAAKNAVIPVAKKDILFMVPFGIALYLSRVIFIDRRKPKDANRILKASADFLFKNQANIVICPEGTRNKNPVKLQPFKKGAFTLAIACQSPIIPLVASPYYFLDAQKHIFNKGDVIIQCLEPISTKGLSMDDLPELIARVQNVMELAYEEQWKNVVGDISGKISNQSE